MIHNSFAFELAQTSTRSARVADVTRAEASAKDRSAAPGRNRDRCMVVAFAIAVVVVIVVLGRSCFR